MKAVVLAGGFATRLYPVTEFTPKPLLPVAGKPIIQYIVEKIEVLEEVDIVYISTNERFRKHFENWLSHFSSRKKLKIVVEPASSEQEKIGAIGALNYLIAKENIQADLLVLAGDNLFDFSLIEFVEYYKKKRAPIVAFYDIRDLEQAKRFGVAELDSKKRITSFAEKPQNPKSTLISTGCYLFPKESLEGLRQYILDKNNPDAPGHFVRWLSQKQEVYGFSFRGKWFDIGHMDAYKAANVEYEARLE